jgi:hypothetical protein
LRTGVVGVWHVLRLRARQGVYGGRFGHGRRTLEMRAAVVERLAGMDLRVVGPFTNLAAIDYRGRAITPAD